MSDIFNAVLNGPADMLIGKNGLGPSQMQHLESLIKRKKIIKIKVMKEIAHEQGIDGFIKAILNSIKVYVLDARGFTFILSKRKIPGLNIPKRFSALMEKESEKEEESEVEQEDGVEGGDISQENQPQEPLSKNKERKAKRQASRQDDDFIDYDDKELLDEIDKEADNMYGIDEENPLEEPKEFDRTSQRQISDQKRDNKPRQRPPYKKSSRPPAKKKSTVRRAVGKKTTKKSTYRKKSY